MDQAVSRNLLGYVRRRLQVSTTTLAMAEERIAALCVHAREKQKYSSSITWGRTHMNNERKAQNEMQCWVKRQRITRPSHIAPTYLC